MNEMKLEVVICMGSSCFSRGNKRTIEVIKDYIERNGLHEQVFLKGALCQKNCTNGPNVIVNNTTYENVDSAVILDILKHHLNADRFRGLSDE